VAFPAHIPVIPGEARNLALLRGESGDKGAERDSALRPE